MIRQYGVLAYERSGEKGVRILLITSRDTGRWVPPRGNPTMGLAPHKSATREAWEEAGAVGKAGARQIGTYAYEKRRPDGSATRAKVYLFPLRVERLDDNWPEKGQRERRWFSREEAAVAVDEPKLRALILTFKPRR